MRKIITRTRVILLLAFVTIVALISAGAARRKELSSFALSAGLPVSKPAEKPVYELTGKFQLHDLNNVKSSKKAIAQGERVLVLTPLREAAEYLENHVNLLTKLAYPHGLIDLGFLVGDSKDDTLDVLIKQLERVQSRQDKDSFNSVTIIQKDFNVTLDQAAKERHAFKAQGPRRKAMGRARNYLLAATLTNEHSWIYWRDVDVVESPSTIIQDLTAHDRDVLVPNIWVHHYHEDKDVEGRFDWNSWQESEQGLKLAESLPKDTIIAEGYDEMKTGRNHLAAMGDWQHDKEEEIPLDGVGGVSIMVKADVHRSGVNFPCYAFENQAETEGFAKMAKRAGYGVYGLPNYIVWHMDTHE